MDIKQDVIAAIGNTPLIKLRKASELTGCTILGKAEFMNPGQSVKDRAAKYMIEDAERRSIALQEAEELAAVQLANVDAAVAAQAAAAGDTAE